MVLENDWKIGTCSATPEKAFRSQFKAGLSTSSMVVCPKSKNKAAPVETLVTHCG